MKELEKKKLMLLAESEVCRQTLRLELQNVRLFTVQTKRFKRFGVPQHTWLLAAAAGAFSFWARRRRFSVWRLGGLGLLGWQTARRLAPFYRGLVSGHPPAESEYHNITN